MMDRRISNVLSNSYMILAAVLLCAGGVRVVLFNGLQGSDDLAYARIAWSMAEGNYHPEAQHFYLRHGLLIPLAMLFRVLGVSEWISVIPTFGASLGCVLMTYLIGIRLFGRKAGILAALMLAFFPLDIILATTVAVDPFVSFWCGVTGWLLTVASDRERKSALILYLVSGLTLGMGYFSKEITLLFLPAFFLWIWLDRYRWHGIAALVIGFGCTVAAEFLVYATWVEDLFFRFHTAQGTHAAAMALKYDADALWYRLFAEYLLSFLNPRLSHEFGLFYLTAALLLFIYRDMLRQYKVRLVCMWWSVSFLAVNFAAIRLWPYVPLLESQPRHILALSIPCCILLGAMITHLPTWRWQIAVCGVLCISSILYVNLIRANHLAGPIVAHVVRTAANVLKGHPEIPIYTDTRTREVLRFFFQYLQDDRVRPFPKEADVLYGGFVVINQPQVGRFKTEYGSRIPEYVVAPPLHWRTERIITTPISMFEQMKISLANRILNMNVIEIKQDTLTIYTALPLNSAEIR